MNPTLIDTNILLRSVQPSHPLNAVAVRALETLMTKGEPLFVAVQNLAEFWNVATRPVVNNGLGYTIEEAQAELARIEGFFDVLTENEASYAIWKTLLSLHRVSGVQVHDARLVAVMKAHDMSRIVTLNVSDFARFPDIEAIYPGTVT
ncbi:MAG: PIN domain-containing protein [Bryobacterales bacterium]|nr:PIN domain-containing protein [Bryobacterales bacterium]